MRAQIVSTKIIEGPAGHLKHTVAVAYAESFRDFVSDFATSSQNNGDLQKKKGLHSLKEKKDLHFYFVSNFSLFFPKSW